MINNFSLNIYNEVYKNTQMGINALSDMLPQTKNEDLKSHLTSTNEEYQKYNKKVLDILEKENLKPKELGAFNKFIANTNIKINTLIDNSSSHISEMLISGTTMGIIDLEKALNENEDADNLSVDIAQSLIQIEQKSIDEMKKYL